MSFISVFRLAALSISLLLGLVVLGLTGHWIQITIALADEVGGAGVKDFEIVAVVAGVLTLLSLPTMLVVGLIRRGAFTSMVAVELSILPVLWVLFLAVGALTAQWKDIFFPFGCGDTFDLTPTGQGWCREFFAIMGCSFVVWIVLFLYTTTLLIFALIGKSRGNTVWTTSVAEASFLETKPNNEFLQPVGVPVYIPAAATYTPATPQQYPMTQQYTGSTPGHSGLAQV